MSLEDIGEVAAPAASPSGNPKERVASPKVPLALVPPCSTIYEAMAFLDGAGKYGAYNWRSEKVRAMVYLNAAMRHIAAYVDGEESASDSGVPHLGHAKACLGIVIDAFENGNLIDDRPPAGMAAQVLERFKKLTEALRGKR